MTAYQDHTMELTVLPEAEANRIAHLAALVGGLQRTISAPIEDESEADRSTRVHRARRIAEELRATADAVLDDLAPQAARAEADQGDALAHLFDTIAPHGAGTAEGARDE
ncbi:hypothetical protein [Salininema proteolyticum]|uniref:Uncharacterized protein n=1 Tax=Salininema proteolyticum TaxID=1607685 RepID=A0ABV8TTI6_9ACTN